MHPRFLIVLATLLLSTWLIPRVVSAQATPLGTEHRINTTTTHDQGDPRIAIDAEGDYVVVWADGENIVAGLDGSSLGIVGQRFDRTGQPIGSEFVVNTDTLGYQDEPAVAMDAEGNFVVVWTDGANFGGDGDGDLSGIAGQLFDSEGSPVGGQFQVNVLTAAQQLAPDVGMDTQGNFVVAWGSAFENQDIDLFARRFDASGAPLGTEFQVNTTVGGRHQYPAIDFDEDGNFVIGWTSTVDFVPDTVLRRYDSAGNSLSGELPVATSAAMSRLGIDLAMTDEGDFVVVWADFGQDGSDFGIYGQQFDSTATPVGSEFMVNSYTTNGQFEPTVALDDRGNFTVAWTSFTQDGSRSGVFGQQFDSEGLRLGTEFQVNTFTAGCQGGGGADLAMSPDGVFTVVWQDGDSFVDGQDGSGLGVYAQRFRGTSIDPDLVGLWLFDEGSGTVAANSAGNGLDGVLESGTGWTPGLQSTAVLLDGGDDLVRVVDPGAGSPIDVTEALTVAAWVRPDALDGSTQVLVSKDNSYELEVGKLGAPVWDLRLDNTVVATAPTPLEEAVWQHVAVTWDGTTVTFYYNGLLDGTGAFSGSLVPNDDDLGLGARPAPPALGGPVFHFEGAMDRVEIYNRALDATEIADLVLGSMGDLVPPVRSSLAPTTSLPGGTTVATLSLVTDEATECRYHPVAGTPFADMSGVFATTGGTSHSTDVAVSDGIHAFYVRCRDTVGNTNGSDAGILFGVGSSDLATGAVATWELDEGSGCIAGDSEGGSTGALGPSCPANAPQWSVGHDGGGALTFDGNDDQVTVTKPLTTPTGLTFSAWIRHSVDYNFRAIFDVRDEGDDGATLYVNDQNRLMLRINATTLVGTSVVADGTWHHVVGTWDGTTMRLYVDGALDFSAPGGTPLDIDTDLFLGHHFANHNHTFLGELSRAAVWDRALSEVEVLDLFLATR